MSLTAISSYHRLAKWRKRRRSTIRQSKIVVARLGSSRVPTANPAVEVCKAGKVNVFFRAFDHLFYFVAMKHSWVVQTKILPIQ